MRPDCLRWAPRAYLLVNSEVWRPSVLTLHPFNTGALARILLRPPAPSTVRTVRLLRIYIAAIGRGQPEVHAGPSLAGIFSAPHGAQWLRVVETAVWGYLVGGILRLNNG